MPVVAMIPKWEDSDPHVADHTQPRVSSAAHAAWRTKSEGVRAMKWEDMRRSENVEDARSGGGGIGFGGPGIRLGGGAIIVVVVLSLLLGKNPLAMLALLGGGEAPTVQTQSLPPAGSSIGAAETADPQKRFVSKVLGDTEDVWGSIFQQMGTRYDPPKLHLYNGYVQSACGQGQAAMGPFYCPGDQRVYLDMSFFQELS